jgi:multiple sugar transport system substrate-binding protein
MQWFYRPEFLIRYQEEGYGNLVLPGLVKIAKPATQTGSQYFIPDFKNADAVWPVPPFVSKIEGKDFSVLFADYVSGREGNLDNTLDDLTARYNKALARNIDSGTVQRLVLPNFDPTTLITK